MQLPRFRRPLLRFLLSVSLSLVAAQTWAGDAPSSEPHRLKRSDAFLGIHFDFHAGPDCTEVGRNTTRAMIEAILDQVKPDYLQIDCKGHPGFSSYPTKVGHPAPGFVGDPLRLWRQVTAERGVALYLHYSGVWDGEAVRRHPDWAVVKADGQRDDRMTSVFGPYVDQLLIPQLRELAGDYRADGVWVDGECWATVPDYGAAATAAFRAATGIDVIPKKPGEAHWIEWMDFHREAFRKYLRHYLAALKESHPDFEVASNWAFSDHMPEPVSADVAFLSGDFSPQNSLNSARFSARCLQNQGKPWDLMSWSFSAPQGHPVRPLKSVKQLEQEAAIVLAQGGGYQAYFRQKRDGSIYDWHMKLMAEVAQFCRERQALCHRAEALPQVALLYSRAAHYRQSPALFAPWGSDGIHALRGVLQALLESQNSVQIVSEHHLTGRMADWPLIVLPEWSYLEPAFRDELAAYARNGGGLLLVGPKAGALFARELGVELDGETATAARYLEHDGWLAGLNTPVQRVRLGGSAQPFGKLHHQDDPRSAFDVAASIAPLGRGKIAAIWFNFGDRYLNARVPTARHFLEALVRQLFPHPIVEVTGSSSIDVSVARNHGRLLVHFVNTAGPHEQEKQYVFDDFPAAGPLQVAVRIPAKPESVYLEPGHRRQRFGYRDGQVLVTLPPVEIHDVLVITP
ncbi:MAG: hypothetical protein HS113_26355 [Verrucomicrobiales bacterium]|nr:hypothetical protein [Verrucomicrobiales bacterium]